MTKRVREDYLTPDLLAQQLAEESDERPADNAAAAFVGERKIVRVKRHHQQTGQVTTEEGPALGVFRLTGSLTQPS